jgi:nitroreductase
VEFDEVVRKRRMVHRFQRRPVPAELLEEVLEKALHAPSAGFSQGLQLVVLQDQASLDRFWQLTDPDGASDQVLGISSSGPPTLVLVLTDPTAYTTRYSEPDKADAGMQEAGKWPVPYWYVDAGMAALLILQTAVDRGLGAWFFGVVDGEAELRQSLGVPDGLLLVGVIGIGYQAYDDRPIGSAVTRPRRLLDDTVHAEAW